METINMYNEIFDQWSEKYFARKYNSICNLNSSSRYILIAELSRDPNITLNTVKNHPEVEWNHEELSLNSNITVNMVKSETNINWNEQLFSANPSVTIETIRNNPDIGWDYHLFSANENVTWEIVKENPDIDWDYHNLSINPNITLKTIGNDSEIINRFDYGCLIDNEKIIRFKTDKFKREMINIMIRSEMQQWFKRSKLREELMVMVTLWRPVNFKMHKIPQFEDNDDC